MFPREMGATAAAIGGGGRFVSPGVARCSLQSRRATTPAARVTVNGVNVAMKSAAQFEKSKSATIGFQETSLDIWDKKYRLKTKSGEIMVMVIMGGMGTLFGPVFGAATFLLLEELLSTWTEHWMIFLGPLLILIVLFAKRGLYGWLAGRDGGS